MDNLSRSSGRISETITDRERGKLTQETKGENELTLMRLRRLSRTVMSKNERHRFEARKLFRSSIIKFLESYLTHHSEKVRYLALELLCCTIPRLANKTDCLLNRILPKVFQCLRNHEGKDMKLKALHFLRGFFRHSKCLSSFIDNFVRLGIENADPDIRMSCCLGLNIVFDQDIGNIFFSKIVVSVGNLLIQVKLHNLIRSAYRSLKHIHRTVGDDRFFDMINKAHPDSIEMYKELFTFEKSDSFLSTNSNDCSTLVSEYQLKRKELNLNKDFGILDSNLLDCIQETKNCERAKTLFNFVTALKRTSWTEEDLDPHILDFLTIINSFTSDSNRLIQMSGLDILKEVINRMGFVLSPHIRFVVEILRRTIISANSKVKSKACRVVHKLMRNIHPMTVLWELLSTKNVIFKEAVLNIIEEKIISFPYYELDMIALCNYLGQCLDRRNRKLAERSRDCIILLLEIMRGCPVYDIRKEAVKVLLRNYPLSRETLKDIKVFRHSDDDYQEGFESYSDDETTDIDTTSIPKSSTTTDVSVTYAHKSISTAGETEAQCIEACSDLSLRKSCNSLCRNSSSIYLKNPELFNEEPRQKEMKSGISVPYTHRSMLTADESDARSNETCSQLSLRMSSNSLCAKASSIYTKNPKLCKKELRCKKQNRDIKLDLPSQSSIQTPMNWEDNSDVAASTKKIDKNVSTEYYSDTSTVKEQISSEVDSHSSRCLTGTSNSKWGFDTSEKQRSDFITPNCSKYGDKEFVASNQDSISNFKDRKSENEIGLPDIYLIPKERITTAVSNAVNSDNASLHQQFPSGNKQRKYFSCFCMKADHITYPDVYENHCNQDTQAGGDDVVPNNSMFDHQKKSDSNINLKFITESYEQDGVRVDIMDKSMFNFNIMQVEHHQNKGDIEEIDEFEYIEDKPPIPSSSSNKKRINILQMEKYGTPDKFRGIQGSKEMKRRISKSASIPLSDKISPKASHKSKNKTKFSESSLHKQQQSGNAPSLSESIDCNDSNLNTPITSNLIEEENFSTPVNSFTEELLNKYMDPHGQNRLHILSGSNRLPEVESTVEVSDSCNKVADETEAPFIPKSRQLPRTPVQKKKSYSSEVQSKLTKNGKRFPVTNKRAAINEKNQDKKNASMLGPNPHCAESEKSMRKMTLILNGTDVKSSGVLSKHNSPINWRGCQWRRDLEYSAKAAPCPWADKFDKLVHSMPAFPSSETAESEMKKAIDDLYGKSWKEKEDAMLTVLRLAKHHHEVVLGNTSKIVVALSNEIKNFRQSVAGKAILTTGHLYEMMGKDFENKLRLVVAALLAKSGNRTLAAYFRLVIKSLIKIINSTSPHKAVMAFIHEGSRHPNKAAKETAAQFLAMLTESIGPANSLSSSLSSHMLKCAAMFVSDSSALTRYCGKRMFNVFLKHPDFEKLKDHHLDINTAQSLSKVLEQIESKGVREEMLPIKIIDRNVK